MDTSFHIKPFGFDRIFSVAAPEAAVKSEDLHLQLAALEAELESLRIHQEAELAIARSEAFEAGLGHARRERDTALLAAVDALQASIESVDQEIDRIARSLTEDAAELALAAGEALAARALAEAPGAAIDEAIGRALKQVARGQDITVRVHPDLAPEIERLIAFRQSQDRRRLNLHVVPDDSLALGDARLDWDQGGLALDQAERAAAIQAELGGLLAAA